MTSDFFFFLVKPGHHRIMLKPKEEKNINNETLPMKLLNNDNKQGGMNKNYTKEKQKYKKEQTIF